MLPAIVRLHKPHGAKNIKQEPGEPKRTPVKVKQPPKEDNVTPVKGGRVATVKRELARPAITPSKRARLERQPAGPSQAAEKRWRALPAHDPDRLHRESCKVASCARCLWAENKSLWVPCFPLDQERPEAGSWLQLGVEPMTRRAGVGCKACALYKLKGAGKWATWGTVGRRVRKTLLKQHSQSATHKAALR